MNSVLERWTANEATTTPGWPEVRMLKLDRQQAALVHRLSAEVSQLGGPDQVGTRGRVALAAAELGITFSSAQSELLRSYTEGRVSALVIDGLEPVFDESPPAVLPKLDEIERRKEVFQIGVRSQLLLKLVDHRAFAYDLDNDAKIIRVVANLKGGGDTPIETEPDRPELSSHSGLALGPHTEAPYFCAVKSETGHSPSPSALILSALWNPQFEPTSIIPLPTILETIGVDRCLALTAPWFQFTRSDSFVQGKGEDGNRVSILSFDDCSGGFAARFNAYRFTVMEEAPPSVKEAYSAFCAAVSRSVAFQHTLSQRSAIIINNTRSLHCREIVKDNRRALIRLFAYSKHAEPVIYSQDPLLVRG